MTRRARYIAIWSALAAIALSSQPPPAWGQDAAAAETSDTTGIAVPPPVVDFVMPDTTALRAQPRALPPIPPRRISLAVPPMPVSQPRDSVVVPQAIDPRTIDDPEAAARADSINRVLRMLAIEERLLDAELSGAAPRVGLLTRKDYLEARVDVLRGIENRLADRLRLQQDVIDAETAALDSAVAANRDRELDELEGFIARYPDSRYVADAKFILGQLYYDREEQRYRDALKRWQSEATRFRLNLIPVPPRVPVQNESISVPYYRDVVRLGTNRELVPYSLYSLGKYHLDQARGFTGEADANRDLARHFRLLASAQTDSAKLYFARLVSEFPDDSINVPEAYFVLASHYNVLGGIANRDTAAVYANALIRRHWYAPRFQATLRMLAEINFANGIALSISQPERSARYYADALAYLAWLAREIDAFEAEQLPGVTPDAPPMLDPGRRDDAVAFMTQIITRRSPVAGRQIPPVQTAIKLVAAAGGPPFGADLLRQVGDNRSREYETSQNSDDLVAALTAYDSLLARYPTYSEGPRIQQTIIDNATFLSADPQERVRIFLNQKILFYERFNRNSRWAKSADVPIAQKKAADDSAASYLEQAARYLYVQARNAGDREQIRRTLGYFTSYFQTYPERPQAYELNWNVATELRDLGDLDRAYDEFMRITKSPLETHREDAAIEAIAAAQRLLEAEQASGSGSSPQQGQ